GGGRARAGHAAAIALAAERGTAPGRHRARGAAAGGGPPPARTEPRARGVLRRGRRDRDRRAGRGPEAAIVRTVTATVQGPRPGTAQAGEAMSETTDRTGLGAGIGR